MEISLNVIDRLTIISILPLSGKLTDLVEIFDLVKKLKFSDEEKVELEMVTNQEKVMWNLEKDIEKKFEISFEQLRIIKDKIKELDEKGLINIASLETCLKFNKL